MQMLREPPAGFDAVRRAYTMARHVPTTHRLGLRVGIVSGDQLVAEGVLDGYRQTSLFSDHLRTLGYAERLLGGDDDMHECDMVFVAPGAVVREADPSFIRPLVMERWGAQTAR